MNNATLFAQAKRVIAGGVNSPVRAFKAVGGVPIFIKRAQGAYVYDHDEQRYIDYVGSWGAMILGHAAPSVVTAVQEIAQHGLSFGAPTSVETHLAETLCARLAWVDKLRMVNSGTEATMSAIRLARGYTGRDKIIKFEGCYHGHADALLVKAGSGALTFGVPTSPGIPASVAEHTLTANYNDIDSVKHLFDQVGDQVAAVIIEPVAGNMNCVPPVDGFLAALRQLCDQYGSLLIMDEVMSGFRVGPQGAQGLYAVYGDITVLGKIIGGGLPVGAFGARQDIMAQLSPDGGVYQAGTLSGNPLGMAAGLATLQGLEQPDLFQRLEHNTTRLVDGIQHAAQQAGVALSVNHVGGMFGLFFTAQNPVTSFDHVNQCDRTRFNQFFHGMLAQGIYLAPSSFEAGFVSAAHTEDDIEQTIDAAHRVFAKMAGE